jgi:NAD(P)-dependent dehydrogenase (short-subunit alcohol dehydrogenase family)
MGLTLDVRLEQDMNEMVRRTLEQFGRIDILVACAGIGKRRGSVGNLPRPVSHLPIEDWDAILDTNLKGVFLSNRAVLPVMIKQRKGQIVNISSSPGGVAGQPFSAAYCASKFGVTGLSEALAAEVQPYGIRVQVVFPDATDTPLIRDTTLTARLGQPLPPDRVANHILFLVTAPEDTTWPSGGYGWYSILRRAFVTGTVEQSG